MLLAAQDQQATPRMPIQLCTIMKGRMPGAAGGDRAVGVADSGRGAEDGAAVGEVVPAVLLGS